MKKWFEFPRLILLLLYFFQEPRLALISSPFRSISVRILWIIKGFFSSTDWFEYSTLHLKLMSPVPRIPVKCSSHIDNHWWNQSALINYFLQTGQKYPSVPGTSRATKRARAARVVHLEDIFILLTSMAFYYNFGITHSTTSSNVSPFLTVVLVMLNVDEEGYMIASLKLAQVGIPGVSWICISSLLHLSSTEPTDWHSSGARPIWLTSGPMNLAN